MPRLYARHRTETELEREIAELWNKVDQLDVREQRLRQNTFGVPGAPAAIVGAFGVVDAPSGTDPVAAARADVLTLASAAARFSITGDAPSRTVTFDVDVSDLAPLAHTHAIDALSDVTITSADAGDYLRYSGAAWVDVGVTQLLADLKTVDGAGSGLDADLLDGLSSAAFSLAGHTHVQTDVTDWPLTIARGGTGQTTQQAAIDALTDVASATDEHVLTKDTATGNAVFKAAAGGGGGGDVVGPAGATDNAICRYDTATGKLIQDSGVTVDDSGSLDVTNSLTVASSIGINVTPTHLLHMQTAGTAKATTDYVSIDNSQDAGDNDTTASSILYRHEDSGGTISDAARLVCGRSMDWSATTATHDSYLAFHTAYQHSVAERLRITNEGSIGVNISDVSGLGAGVVFGLARHLQGGTQEGALNFTIVCVSNTAGHVPTIQYRKGRGTNPASPSDLQNGDRIGSFSYAGYLSGWKERAWIKCEVDGTPSGSSLPMAILFGTGITSVVERLRIDSAGDADYSGGDWTVSGGDVRIPSPGNVILNEAVSGSESYVFGNSTGLVLQAGNTTAASKLLRMRCGATYVARYDRSSGTSKFGIFGKEFTPQAQPGAFTITNDTTDRTFDANSTSVDELADVLATLIRDLAGYGWEAVA